MKTDSKTPATVGPPKELTRPIPPELERALSKEDLARLQANRIFGDYLAMNFPSTGFLPDIFTALTALQGNLKVAQEIAEKEEDANVRLSALAVSNVAAKIIGDLASKASAIAQTTRDEQNQRRNLPPGGVIIARNVNVNPNADAATAAAEDL